jgi:hypothetical protein
MAAIPWDTFRAPGNLSGVFEVDNEKMYAASIAARENYDLCLDPDEVVPLAVALYNEDFRRLVAQAWGRRRCRRETRRTNSRHRFAITKG